MDETKAGSTKPTPTQALAALGQSLWLDDSGGDLVASGRLARYIDGPLGGLSCNAAGFAHAIAVGDAHDETIARQLRQGESGEALAEALVVELARQAADLLRPRFDASGGAAGWLALDVATPADGGSESARRAAARLHAACARPNVLIALAGTPAGLEAAEASLFAGIPIAVTRIFSPEQLLVATDACLRALERRRAAGLDPKIPALVALGVSRWDAVVQEDVAQQYQGRLGIAIAMQAYRAYRQGVASPRWQALATAGGEPPRLAWASGDGNDGGDPRYVEALAAPQTVAIVREAALLAFAERGKAADVLPEDGGYSDSVLEELRRENVNFDALAGRLQREAVDADAKARQALLTVIAERARAIAARR